MNTTSNPTPESSPVADPQPTQTKKAVSWLTPVTASLVAAGIAVTAFVGGGVATASAITLAGHAGQLTQRGPGDMRGPSEMRGPGWDGRERGGMHAPTEGMRHDGHEPHAPGSMSEDPNWQENGQRPDAPSGPGSAESPQPGE